MCLVYRYCFIYSLLILKDYKGGNLILFCGVIWLIYVYYIEGILGGIVVRRKVILVIIFAVAVFLTGCSNKNSGENKNTHVDTNINTNNVVINNADNTLKDEKIPIPKKLVKRIILPNQMKVIITASQVIV